MQTQFVRKTVLNPNEYQANFTITDNDTIDVLTSAAALKVTALMPSIYFRLKRSPTIHWEREGVLRFTGCDSSEGKGTAWEQMQRIAGVSNSTLSKALRWMHEQGIIGYDAHKNGVGIRIFFNRAASSIRKRETQKNLRLVPAPTSKAPTPRNRAGFKEIHSERDLDLDIIPCASAEDTFAASEKNQKTDQPYLIQTREYDQVSLSALTKHLVAAIEPQISAAVQRETQKTREWFLNNGLPKATRVAQRETFDLLRAYGIVSKISKTGVRVGESFETPQQSGEAEKIAVFLEEVRSALRQVSTRSTHSPEALRLACHIVDQDLGEIYNQTKSGESFSIDELTNQLEGAENCLTKALWESTDPEECEAMLQSAREELRIYQSRMEPQAFENTIRRRVTARLKEKYEVPQLSLFYR